MTDDEQARLVLDALAGIRRCPTCGGAMEAIELAVDVTGKPERGWCCVHVEDNPEHAVYMLDDGTQLKPGPSPTQFTSIHESDFTWDEATGKWVPD